MKKKRTRITQEIIKEINEKWHRNHNYAQTGRELGISGTTVKKYVIPDYILEENREKLPELSSDIIEKIENSNNEDWILFLDYLEGEEEEKNNLNKYLAL